MSLPAAEPASPQRFHLIAFLALIASATAMGISPVFVRTAEVGPFTSAFYRVALALPLLAAWARLEGHGGAGDAPSPRWSGAIVLSGMFFSGDLIFWHLAVRNTTLANATLLTTMAPVWVVAFSGLFIGEKVERLTILGLAVCVAGGALLVGASLQLAPERFLGDMYGVATSFFFGLYFLAVRVARRQLKPGLFLFRSSVITSVLLAGVAAWMEGNWLPMTWHGVVALVLMAWVSHVGGQGLLTYALGHLTASFSSLVIFLEALAAAIFGWLFFAEAIGWPQLAGGGAILVGIWIARPRELPVE